MNILKVLFIVSLISLASLIGEDVFPDVQEEKKNGTMISTLTGVDFNRVNFLVWTQPEHADRLYARAIKHFTEAGLLNGNVAGFKKEATMNLDLTLRVVSSNRSCNGKSMYRRTLKLTEEVRPVSHPQVTLLAVTWSVGFSIPISSDDGVTLEQLEADLDRLVFEFIHSYKMGNSK